MAKLNKKEADKKYFDRYKNTGRREENKRVRQEKAEKRIQKLKEKAEKKKANRNNKELNKGNTQIESNTQQPHRFNKEERREYRIEKRKKMMVAPDYRDYAWWDSLFAKLDGELKAEEKDAKRMFGVLNNKGKVTIEIRREEEVYNG